MELILVALISLATAAIVSVPYFVGQSLTPPGFTFLGTVHYAQDYLYYLSYLAQGADRWLLGANLHSGELQALTLVNWMYVLLGRIFYLLHISPIVGYQLAVAAGVIFFVKIAYQFIARGLQTPTQRIGALLLFLTSNAFPIIANGHLSYYTSWFNYGHPFIRISSVPHHLLVQGAILLALLLAAQWSKKHLWLLAFLGFFLGSLQPVQWMIVSAVVGLTAIVANRPRLPAFILIISGLPPVLYLRQLFTTQPYIQTAVWEAWQQVYISPIDFLLNNGPVMLLGLGGLILWFQKKNLLWGMGILYTILVTGIFFSTVPQHLRILNVRFLSSIPILVYAIAATELLDNLAGLWSKRTGRTLLFVMMTTLLLTIAIPVGWLQLTERLKFDTNNAFFYVRTDAYEALKKVVPLTTPDQTIMVVWPYTEVFPALTGRRVYFSNFLATAYAEKKGQLEYQFFDGKLDEAAMEQLVRDNHIAYIVSYPWSFAKKNLPFLERIYENAALTIYKVK